MQTNQLVSYLTSKGVNPSVARQLANKLAIMNRSGRTPSASARKLVQAASQVGGGFNKPRIPTAGGQGFSAPGSDLMEGGEDEIQMRPSPERNLHARGFPNPGEVEMPKPEEVMTPGQVQSLAQKALLDQ